MLDNTTSTDAARWFEGLLAARALPAEIRMLAHRFNNQLTVLSAHLSLVKELATDDDVMESVRTMEETVDRLAATMATVRELAGPPSRGLQLVHPSEVLREFREAVLRLDIGGVDLEVELDTEAPPVTTGRSAVVQVLHELVDNAVAAVRNHGDARVRVWAETRQDGSALVVEDTGAGLDPAVADRLGEPFITTRPGHAGLGICLAMAALERYGARLAWSPRPQRGSRFEILLPSRSAVRA
jgi:C4-dicarboxylate-specific signal transduction histidine kinase